MLLVAKVGCGISDRPIQMAADEASRPQGIGLQSKTMRVHNSETEQEHNVCKHNLTCKMVASNSKDN